MDKFKRVVWYFLPFLKKYKYSVGLTFIFYGLAIVLGNILVPLMYKNIIDVLSGDLPIEQMKIFFVILVVISIARYLLDRLGDYFIVKFQTKGMKDVYNYSLEKISNHSYRFFTDNFVGSLVTKTKRFVSSYEQIFDTILFSFYFTTIYMTGMFIVLLQENIILGFVFLGWVVIFLGVIFYINKRKIPLNLVSAEKDSLVSGSLSDIITNILNVKIFSARKLELNHFEDITNEDYEARYKKWMFDNFIWRIQAGMLLFFELVAMGAALYFWTRGEISTGTVVLLQIYIASLAGFLWNLGKSIIRFTTAVSDSVEFVNIIDQSITVMDILDVQESTISQGNISFNQVSFTYPEGDHVFEKFNLNISKGQSVGVVGKSGSGKTTLTKLLLRFYDIDVGSITIDNQNIAEIKQDDLRQSIAYIPQETILFHRTIYENIAYGDTSASREEVLEAAQSAHVDEFVQNLELGYETKVGERGIKLSGGQRQRIGIARAMLKKEAPILVLDEATSSLDSMSEGYIQDSFEKLSQNRTTIVIAHRLSTIQKMDRIIVMENGKRITYFQTAWSI